MTVKRRFPFVPFDEIKPSASSAFLVRHLIPRDGITLVWGPPKCGKTFWVLDLVMHIALNWAYRGRRVKVGQVAYVACEGELGLKRRIEAFRRARLGDTRDTPVPFYLFAGRLDLPNEYGQLIDDIRQDLSGGSCSCIVLDTLNRSIGGPEDDVLMPAYVRAADALRQAFGAAVIIVHHCGVDDRRPRGHTSLTGAVDAQIKVTNRNKIISAEVEHMKDGDNGATISSKLAVVILDPDEDKEQVTSCAIEPVDDEPSAKRRRRVSGAAQVVLDLARKAIQEAGVPAPASHHIPAGVRVVTLELLRNYAYQGSISDADTADAKRKAFGRSLTKLQAEGLIGVWGEYAWLI